MSGLGAVLFDMDGLLVDSEPLWYDVEVEIVRRHGGTWAPADQHACLGGPLQRTAAVMAGRVPSPVSPADVETELTEGMALRLGRGVPLKPGAGELLAALAAAGVPCGLVSSSYRRLVDLVLRDLRPGTFAVSVAGDEVTHRKPHPEPYLTAAARLGVPASRCVVLEDSLTGLLAGEAAGCACVGVPDIAPIPATSTRPVITSLADIELDWLSALPDRLAATG